MSFQILARDLRHSPAVSSNRVWCHCGKGWLYELDGTGRFVVANNGSMLLHCETPSTAVERLELTPGRDVVHCPQCKAEWEVDIDPRSVRTRAPLTPRVIFLGHEKRERGHAWWAD